jgi:hypothetical protein
MNTDDFADFDFHALANHLLPELQPVQDAAVDPMAIKPSLVAASAGAGAMLQHSGTTDRLSLC